MPTVNWSLIHLELNETPPLLQVNVLALFAVRLLARGYRRTRRPLSLRGVWFFGLRLLPLSFLKTSDQPNLDKVS